MAGKVNRIITFYSYKGGVGRSMAMANIGLLLAKWKYKVLVIDWDLEAPGIENYYKDLLNPAEVSHKNGLIDLLHLKIDQPDISADKLDWALYITTMEVDKVSNLHLMTAGKRDEHYTSKVQQFDYISFYNKCNGGQYLEDLRDYWLDNYDLILIDSRTGLTDSSGICSIHMPDILVLMFTANEQSFNGIKSVSQKAIEGQKQIIYDRFRLRTLPIPARIENAETSLLDEWMKKIYAESEDMLEWLPRKEENTKDYLITPAQFINHIRIPYRTLYAYGEKLAVHDRGTSDPLELGYVYETIAAALANDLQSTHLLIDSRDTYIKKAKGELSGETNPVITKTRKVAEKIPKQFNNIIKKQLNAFVAWLPISNSYQLGDYGIITDGIFTTLGNIKEFDILITERKEPGASFDFTSGNIKVMNFAAGMQVDVIPEGATDTKVTFQFQQEKSFLIKSSEIIINTINNITEVGAALMAHPKWQKNYKVVHKTFFAKDAIIISTSEAGAEISFTGDLGALRQLKLGDPSVNIKSKTKIALDLRGSGVIALGLFQIKKAGLFGLGDVQIEMDSKNIEDDF